MMSGENGYPTKPGTLHIYRRRLGPDAVVSLLPKRLLQLQLLDTCREVTGTCTWIARGLAVHSQPAEATDGLKQASG